MSRLALGFLVLSACGSEHGGSSPPRPGIDAGPGGADASTAEPPERSCLTTVSFTPAAPVATVELAGAWDWQARTPLSNQGGTWSVALDLPAGVHAYKLIVDGQWQLDPAQPWRAYDGEVENSALRVPDCTRPEIVLDRFQLEPDGALVTAKLRRGAGGPALTAADVSAVHVHDFVRAEVAFELRGDTVSLALTGLPPGKHTVQLSVAGGEPLTLPFWREAERFTWDGEAIYMLMVDRFRDGNPGNNPPPAAGAAPSADFHGGDLAGVTAALEDGSLDHIRVLWLSPFVANATRVHGEGGQGVTGYHGYWPVSGREIDTRFGTPAELEALVKAAHARGVRVLMDLVLNHVHEDHAYVASHPDWFRTGCVCGTDGCGWTEARLACLFHPYMPDVDWRNSAAADQMIADALFWMTRYDLDGFRVDAVKHVEDLAVRHLRAAVAEGFEQAGTKVFLLGETAMGWAGHDVAANAGEYATISRYVGPEGLSGQFDFVLYHAAAYRVFASGEHGLAHADFWTRQSLASYPAGSVMTPFVGSHDSQRIVTLAEYRGTSGVPEHKWPSQGLPAAPTSDEPYERAALALTWALTLPGAPLLYYGDEYGEFGATDPDNRHMWRPPAARSPRETSMAGRLARVLAARRVSPALRVGGYRSVVAEEDVLVFAREADGDLALVGLNRGDTPALRRVDATGAMQDLLSGDTAALVDGQVTLELPARGAAIYRAVR